MGLAREPFRTVLIMTGALRSTATDVLEAHADLLPFDLLVKKVCQRAAVRLHTLPNEHPLAPHVRRASKCYVKSHKSALHELTDAFRGSTAQGNIETVRPARLHPRWKPRHRVHILEGKARAAKDDQRWARHGAFRVYTDGSDIDGGVGAAALLYAPGRRRPRILRYYLGPSTRHTVYEAEIVATILGVELLRAERHAIRRASIALDNTAAIRASTLRTSAPGRYLTDIFHTHVKKLKDARPGLRLTLRWVPGHEVVAGNEAVDKAAKEAAAGCSSVFPYGLLLAYCSSKVMASVTSSRCSYAAQISAMPSIPRASLRCVIRST